MDKKMAKSSEPTQEESQVQGEMVELSPSNPATGFGEYRRTISSNQLHVISLGSNIGSGLFIATGKGLADAGAAGALIAYGFVVTCVWAVLQVLGEMTIAFPTSGNFIDFADRFVDPSLAFAAGFAEWLGWCAVLGAEATFFSLIINEWANNSVNEAVWITVFIVGAVVLFCLPNIWFAWFEYFASALKVFALTLFLILSFAMILGAGPNGHVHNGEMWRESAFKNSFGGFSTVALLALWAMSDQVFITIMGGEAESPRYSMAKAAKTVPVRVTLVYMLTLIFMSILISPNDPRLFGGSATAQSPFTIAMEDAGIPGLYQFLNAVILVSCFGFGAESIYIASRILRALSFQGLIPRAIAKVDSRGRPVWALLISGAISITLTYINLSNTGTTIFTWLSSITSSAFFVVWMVISVTSWRFHAALKAQEDPLFTEVFAWQAWDWPFPAIWLFISSVFLLICCIYSGLYPLGTQTASVENFFEYMLGAVIVLVFTILHKAVYRTKVRKAEEADLRTGRRTLGEAEIEMLTRYYSQPPWRRAFSYVRFW